MSLPNWSEVQNTNLTSLNSSYMAYVGWENTSANDPLLEYLFSVENLQQLSQTISKKLEGVDPQGRTIQVSLDKIANVLSNMYRNATRMQIGDIYSRYVVPQCSSRCDVSEINNLTMNTIIKAIRDEYETIENNKKLTVWTTVLGDFNKEGLRSHGPIKIRRRHPQYMAFNWNY